MNPLNMASVTATAVTGAFRQPYLVPFDLDDRERATAQGLPRGTAAQLKQMMRLTATQGTARRGHVRPPRRHRCEDRVGRGRRARTLQQLVHRLPRTTSRRRR
ncbi:hypothetical protein STENM223S_06034 [Streptomyces tendae]